MTTPLEKIINPESYISETPEFFDSEYLTSNMDILKQRALRKANIVENRLYEFMILEGDSNFYRGYVKNSEKIETVISKLYTSKAILSSYLSKIEITKISGIFPKNSLEYLSNLQTTIDMNINFLNDIKRKSISGMLGIIFKKDIEVLGIKLSDLVLMYKRIQEIYPVRDVSFNNAIRSILSINLENILPKSFVDIFDDLQNIGNFVDVFSDNSEEILFRNLLRSNTTPLYKSRISDITENSYDNIKLDFDDILGISAQKRLQNDMTNEISKNLDSVFETISSNPGITSDISIIKESIKTEVNENIGISFSKNIGLPRYPEIINSVSNIGVNDIRQVLLETIEEHIKSSLTSNNIIISKNYTGNSIDFLQNIRRNIEERKQFKQRSGSSIKLSEIENNIRNLLEDKTVSLDMIENNIGELL